MALRLLPCRSALAAIKCPALGMLSAASVDHQQVRGMKANKHYNPKFKNLRRLKVDIKMPLEYVNDIGKGMRDGVIQASPNLKRLWKERNLYVSSTNQIVEEYVPDESKESLVPVVSTQMLKKGWEKVEKLPKNKLAIRKIRSFEKEFNLKVFGDEAQEIYIKAHECLAANDQEKLTDYVTEHARLAMLLNTTKRTIHWKYLQSLEEPRAVQVRTFQLEESSGTTYAQITMRMFSQQSLAVYDRFGRLLYGSEILAKDVLEYVVFEKHLSNEYGQWRIHAKIIPPSLMRMGEQTFVAPKEEESELSTENLRQDSVKYVTPM